MTAYYPDPNPEPETRIRRMYDCLVDVAQPDGTLLVKRGDVFNETMREKVDALLNGAGRHCYQVHQRSIPFQGEAIPFDDEPIQEWQPAEDTMRYMREEVWG